MSYLSLNSLFPKSFVDPCKGQFRIIQIESKFQSVGELALIFVLIHTNCKIGLVHVDRGGRRFPIDLVLPPKQQPNVTSVQQQGQKQYPVAGPQCGHSRRVVRCLWGQRVRNADVNAEVCSEQRAPEDHYEQGCSDDDSVPDVQAKHAEDGFHRVEQYVYDGKTGGRAGEGRCQAEEDYGGQPEAGVDELFPGDCSTGWGCGGVNCCETSRGQGAFLWLLSGQHGEEFGFAQGFLLLAAVGTNIMLVQADKR
uniref:(northern house mosquito) hypothetical protein n=1 Tax=Culex pipiens TaxID=7175 RepID=A0A8D8DGC5_CULPI